MCDLVSVTIEFERREDPITGTLKAAAEAPQRFLGWTGLLAALQTVIDGPPTDVDECRLRHSGHSV